MTVPRGVTDPFSLGDSVVCTKATDDNGVSLDDIYASSGTYLQGDAEDQVVTINAEYYVHTGFSGVTSGETHGGYFFDRVTLNSGNKAHDTMSIQAHKHVAVAITSTL